nr:immunoglobulin light chain junction region [Macaca mulatta]
CQQGYNGPRTF